LSGLHLHILSCPATLSELFRGLGSRQQSAAVLGEEIDEACSLPALAIPTQQVLVYARLKAVLVVGESFEA
jgi:hypothetical protein